MKFKELKLTQEIIEKVMARMITARQQKMRRLLNYLLINPNATLSNIAGHLGLPLSTVYDLKHDLLRILKEIE